ncbi:MAG: hypothetical protein ACRYFS_16550 [Janthinobacterium lividum]
MNSFGVGLTSFLIFTLLFSPPVIAGQLAIKGLRSGSYEKVAAKPKKIFLRPVSVIAFPFTLFVWIILLCTLIADPVFFFSQNWKETLLRSGTMASLFAFILLIMSAYWGVIRWYKRTYPLVLDLERRTYQTVDASSFIPKARIGSLDDIVGITMRHSYAKGTTSYYVQLKLKHPGKLALSLGGFSKPDKAEAFAAKMSRELGLPLVAPPMS